MAAPTTLNANNYSHIETSMLGLSYRLPPHRVRATYTHQQKDIFKILEPTTYLFTANSAVPLADTIRGFYEGLGQPEPQIGYIRANRQASQGSDEIRIRRVREEAERLGPWMLRGARVCIVEQYANSGATVRLAEEIVCTAGINHLASIQGDWYEDALPADIDLESVSSSHREFLTAVGHSAAGMSGL